MKLNHSILLEETNSNYNCRRKSDQDRAQIDTTIKSILEQLAEYKSRQVAFMDLVAFVRARTSFLKPTSRRGSPGWVAPVFLLKRLKNLAMRQSHWIRTFHTWSPGVASVRHGFRSLAHHLLTNYAVPGFMASAWDLEDGPTAFRYQSWFIRLGRGTALRALNLPLVLTKTMEHHARRAPAHYTSIQALRYGEMRGLGGHEKVARVIATGMLGEKIEHSAFWRTVLNFFAANPKMAIEHVNPIIDFIYSNKFKQEECITRNGTVIRTPPLPDFSLKGRTLNSVLRLVTNWHSDLSAKKPSKVYTWKHSGIAGYRLVEPAVGSGQDSEWTIQELVDSGALHMEGRAMRHCVYTYSEKCRRGDAMIWSLRLKIHGEEKRMVTIQVDPRKRLIVQVRAKCNYHPGNRSMEIIGEWARTSGLRFDKGIL